MDGSVHFTGLSHPLPELFDAPKMRRKVVSKRLLDG
jgi:hypothetical protein